MAKMSGPMGPLGFNGSQGPVGPPGPKGTGDLSLCEYKIEESGSVSSGSSVETDVFVAEPSVSIPCIGNLTRYDVVNNVYSSGGFRPPEGYRLSRNTYHARLPAIRRVCKFRSFDLSI